MKITIEHDDGTTEVFTGPGAKAAALKALGHEPVNPNPWPWGTPQWEWAKMPPQTGYIVPAGGITLSGGGPVQ